VVEGEGLKAMALLSAELSAHPIALLELGGEAVSLVVPRNEEAHQVVAQPV
jgi:hypothetical protein